MSKTLWIVLIVIAFFAGMGITFFVQSPASSAEIRSNQTADNKFSDTIQLLSSIFVPGIPVQGSVESINGRQITLTQGGTEKATVKINANAKVFKTEPSTDQTQQSAQKEVAFDQLKKGDNIDIVLKILPDGSAEGQEIYIYPPVPGTSATSTQPI